MKINIDLEKKIFIDLTSGAVFRGAGINIYLKIATRQDDESVNAVNLKTGARAHFGATEEIIPFPSAVLVVE